MEPKPRKYVIKVDHHAGCFDVYDGYSGEEILVDVDLEELLEIINDILTGRNLFSPFRGMTKIEEIVIKGEGYEENED